jgi:hypothetical protein
MTAFNMAHTTAYIKTRISTLYMAHIIAYIMTRMATRYMAQIVANIMTRKFDFRMNKKASF